MSKNQLPSLMPREKLILLGADGLKDYELLAILLRTGRSGRNVIDVAKDITKKFTLSELLELDYENLIKFKGIESSKACTLLAAFEFSRRCLKDFSKTLPIISSPENVLDQVHFIRNKKREYFLVMYLNARNQVLDLKTISIGTALASLVHPREVFAPALKSRAVNVVLIHNHPSGNFLPSKEDLLITHQLVEAGSILGIEVIDHIIVTSNKHCSLKQEGYMELKTKSGVDML